MTQRWTVGAATITGVVEDETPHIPPEFFFPDADRRARSPAHAWVVPDWADGEGNIALRVQAFVVEVGRPPRARRPVRRERQDRGRCRSGTSRHWPFLERFAEAGFDPGGDRHRRPHPPARRPRRLGHPPRRRRWVPTFANARHLYTEGELESCRANANPASRACTPTRSQPIFDAGLADIVDDDADLGDGLRLEPRPATPPATCRCGSSRRARPRRSPATSSTTRCSAPSRSGPRSATPTSSEARETRRRMLAQLADTGALVLGTHFRPPGRPGRGRRRRLAVPNP